MKYSLGIWQVDSQENKIRNTQSDEVIRMSPRAMEVLQYFLQNPDKVVSLEELIEKIWLGRIVGDHAVYRVINKIRKHLDSTNKDAYIETIPRMGYKLVHPVLSYETNLESSNSNAYDQQSIIEKKIVASAEEISIKNETNARVQADKTTPFNRTRLVILFIALLGLCVYFLSTKILTPKLHFQEMTVFNSFQPLSTLPGYQDYPSSSENGFYVIFSYKENEEDTYNLYLKDNRTGSVKKILSSTENDINARISNDAENIVFVRKSMGDCKVIRYKALGDGYLLDNLFNCIGNESLDLELNAEGSKLFYTYRDELDPVNKIYSMIVNTGERKRLTNFVSNRAIGDVELAYSDTKNKIYFLRKPSFHKSIFYEYDFDSQSEKQILNITAVTSDLNIREKNNSITYKSSPTSISEYSLEHKIEKEIVNTLSERIYRYDINNTSDAILLVSGNQENSIWQKNIAGNFGLVQFTNSEYHDISPRYANSNQSIAFISDRSGQQEFWLKESNETEYQLTKLQDREYLDWLRWSPDDKFLLSYDSKSIFVIDVNTGKSENLVMAEEYSDLNMPTWSLDGQSIYFSSKASGDIQLYELNLESRKITQYSETGIVALFDVASQGQFVIKAHRTGLWRVNNKIEQLVVPNIGTSRFARSIELTEQGIYYIQDSSNQLFFISYDSMGSLENVVNLKYDLPSANFSINSNGDKVLFFKTINQDTNILESR